MSRLHAPDFTSLRDRSLLPGGFGSNRAQIWPQLLHVSTKGSGKRTPANPEALVGSPEAAPTDAHRDERQIQLDTDRSFVLYPVESTDETGGRDRDTLQKQLNTLIVDIFHKRPKLNYFQGYHDIITVLFLTLPPELQLPCAEKLSLHRLRDSMGKGLEPVVGLLYILKKLLRIADLEYATLLEQTSPMPYFALSNLLTLFSHDMPTLALIQHVFDYLLCRPPIASVYLAAAIALSRKDEALRLQEDGDDGMLHSLLSGLPTIYDAEEDPVHGPQDEDDSDSSLETDIEVEPIIPMGEGYAASASAEHDASHGLNPHKPDPGSEVVAGPIFVDRPSATLEQRDPATSAHDNLATEVPSVASDFPLDATAPDNNILPSELPASSSADSTEFLPSLSAELSNVPVFVPPPPLPSQPPSPPLSEKSRSPSPPPRRPARASVSLSSLLAAADALYALYPPSYPALCVAQIMGPQSVVHTWSERTADLASDDEAEAMVAHPELVVVPYTEDDGAPSDAEDEKGGRRRRERRRLRKRRRMTMERRVVIASTIIVLGVAMAVYGMRVSGGGAGGGGGGLPFPGGDRRGWRKLGRWAAGALLGVGERLFDGLGLEGA